MFYTSPLKTRYVIKFNRDKRYIILKVTDDRQCCKFRVNRDSHIHQLNKLNGLFMHWSVSKDLISAEDLPLKLEKPVIVSKRLPRRRRM